MSLVPEDFVSEEVALEGAFLDGVLAFAADDYTVAGDVLQ